MGQGAEIIQAVVNAGCFETFLALLKIGVLEDVFDTAEPVTFFAPTDAAFGEMPPDFIDFLCADHWRLLEFIRRHAFPGQLTAKDIRALRRKRIICGRRFETIRGRPVVDGISIVAPDLYTSGNVLHGVGGILWDRPSCVSKARW